MICVDLLVQIDSLFESKLFQTSIQIYTNLKAQTVKDCWSTSPERAGILSIGTSDEAF